MTDTLPAALREALDAPVFAFAPRSWGDNPKMVSLPVSQHRRADRARCMAAALRWAIRDDSPVTVTDFQRVIDALEREAER